MAPTRTLAGSTPIATIRVTRLRAPARRRWWADAVGVVMWATSLVVVALWESNGGVQALTAGTGSAFTRLGRLLGFTSVNLLLAHVVAITIGYAVSAQTGF